MIEKLEYYSSGVERGNAVVWVRHPDSVDLVDKINEIIDVINEMQKDGQDEETLLCINDTTEVGEDNFCSLGERREDE